VLDGDERRHGERLADDRSPCLDMVKALERAAIVVDWRTRPAMQAASPFFRSPSSVRAEHFKQLIADVVFGLLGRDLFSRRVRDIEHVNGLFAEGRDMS
jgi:hypothetical protein